MEKDIGLGVLAVKSLKQQVRSKYKCLVKKIDFMDLALTSQVYKNKDMNKNKNTFKKKQGFKGNCRNCGKYGHKANDCWEIENDKKK